MLKPQIYINVYTHTQKLEIRKKQDGSAQRMSTVCRTLQYYSVSVEFYGYVK